MTRTDPKARAILAAMRRLEKAHHIRILYACESGSRAWGFPSADSDYDVRFIYVHAPDWYWAIDAERRPDTLQEPIKRLLDLSGWDLRKTLRLLAKSNPSLNEWLGSPIVYRQDAVAMRGLRQLRKRYFDRIACNLHYRSMARSNYETLREGPRTAKRYLYVLRPLLAIEWLNRFNDVVPTLFDTLIERLLPNGPIRQAINQLVIAKVAQSEKESTQNPMIDHYIENRMKRDANTLSMKSRPERQDLEPLHRFFQKMVMS